MKAKINILAKPTAKALATTMGRDHSCLTPRQMTLVFGLGTRLGVRTCTTLENGILCNGQQVGRAMNSFIDQGEFVAVKTLSGRKAPRCDKHSFHDKLMAST